MDNPYVKEIFFTCFLAQYHHSWLLTIILWRLALAPPHTHTRTAHFATLWWWEVVGPNHRANGTTDQKWLYFKISVLQVHCGKKSVKNPLVVNYNFMCL